MKRYGRTRRGIPLGEGKIKKRILFSLQENKRLGAGKIAERTNISRATLVKRLPELLKEGYVARDQTTREYYLSGKGLQEISHLQTLEWFEDHSQEIQRQGMIEGRIYDEHGLWITRVLAGGELPPEDLPLPTPVSTSLYLSKEFYESYDRAEASARVYDGLDVKKARAQVLEASIGHLVQEFMIMNLVERCLNLAEWHRAYEKSEIKRKPPSFDLESILGFNLGLIFRYDGKKMAEEWLREARAPEAVREREKVGYRLTGILLLYMASTRVSTPNFSNEDLFDLMAKGELLPVDEAKKLRRLYVKVWGGRMGKSERIISKSPERRKVRKERKAFLKIALEYLHKGDALKLAPHVSIDTTSNALDFSQNLSAPVTRAHQ